MNACGVHKQIQSHKYNCWIDVNAKYISEKLHVKKTTKLLHTIKGRNNETTTKNSVFLSFGKSIAHKSQQI